MNELAIKKTFETLIVVLLKSLCANIEWVSDSPECEALIFYLLPQFQQTLICSSPITSQALVFLFHPTSAPLEDPGTGLEIGEDSSSIRSESWAASVVAK